MKKFIIVALLSASMNLNAQSLSELDSSQYFDFWVGEWIAAWDEGNGFEDLGTNTITKILDGQVIEEQFRIHKGQNAGVKGISISVLQPGLNRWKQAWADNQGSYFDFEGDFEGEKRMFKTQPVERNGQVIIQRMVFYDITADSMMWDWELSRDGGETWNLSWRIKYRKK